MVCVLLLTLLQQKKHEYKLFYFPIPKGRAERVRLTFAAAGEKHDIFCPAAHVASEEEKEKKRKLTNFE